MDFFSEAGASAFLRLYCIIAASMVGFVAVACGITELVHRWTAAKNVRQLAADLDYLQRRLKK